MCIILYKPHNVDNPTKETLQTCWNNNDHGAGFATYDGTTKEWHIQKGFMSWKKFYKAYKAQKFTKEQCYVIHFRIGTSGNRDGGNTHPFVVSDDRDACRQTDIKSKYIAAHNGVVGKGDGKYSDSVCHITDYIEPMLQYYFTDDKVKDIFCELVESGTSRWFITNGDTIHLLGKWVIDEETQIRYSNDGYLIDKVESYYNYGNTYKPAQNRKESKSVSDAIRKGNKKNDSKPTIPSIHNLKKGIKLTQKEREAFVDNFGDIDVGTRHTIDPAKLEMAFVDNEGAIVWEHDEAHDMEYVTCPSCSSDRSFSNSSFDVGDTVCLECGAVFYRDSGDIVTYDGDIVAASIEKEHKDEDKAANKDK
jgi:predicted glutamine amidotransferase